MILIVDDKQENIFSLKTVLEQHGFATDTALSGEEALKKLLKFEYALIILDVQMPGMDGFEVAEAITGLNKTKDIPIIFLSAVNTHKKFVTKGFESGAVDYLTKPVDPDILILKARNFYRLFEKTAALKEAQKNLKQTINELHVTLEALPQIAFTADADGHIQFANKQWLHYATSPDSFPQSADDAPAFPELWRNCIATRAPVEQEVCIRNLEDQRFYYHLLRATPIFENGMITRWVATITNIHEQKLLNEKLEQRVNERTLELLEKNRELEITNHDLQQFTFVASHDLKEPLRKIQLFGSMIQERSQLDAAATVYLNKILHSSGRMSALISDLLSFAKLSKAEAFAHSDLTLIIQDILLDLELLVQEKNARIEVASMPQIEVVPSLMRQLFQNMLINALKFSRPGAAPHIRIWADVLDEPDVDGPLAVNGRYCRIQIQDNGIGFEEKYLNKIFTLFQRLNPGEEYEGTGIGLAIAKKIVEKHNGLITARSTPGQGATFVVILPLLQKTTPQNNRSSLLNSLHS